MGRGRTRAPVDDDHVPWSRPPRRGHRDLAGHGGSGSRNRSGPRPGSGPIGQQGGAGARLPEAAEGLRKFCQRAATITMLQLKLN
jgi:hypothetical protein